MGVHTGDSVTVAPQMTLSDEAYQELRDAAAAVIRAVGVETGGSNIQFARERETGELRVIEMNPRVSRSSALASKATGYPIAKVAAKLAVGYTLDEIPNDLTKTTPASFEPTLDYVVVKFPRFAFEKFPGADRTLGTQMKSVGEAMGIGRTFREAFWKAFRSRELDAGAVTPWESLDDLPEGIHPWFRRELERLARRGAADRARASTGASTRAPGEVAAESNYYYSTFGEADEAPPSADKPRVVIIGSGPNRIGQGIEFDYCCVHAAQSFRALGYEAVMVNCNPETVSTDYDTSDRLYFEPLGAEEVLAVCEREQPEGVVIQFGGQTPLKLARAIEAGGFRILGTPYDAIDLAEDRERFGELLAGLGIRCPEWGIAEPAAARRRRSRTGSATRCSCGPRTCSAAARCGSATAATRSSRRSTRTCSGKVLVDRFVENAIEIDVDALCDGEETYVAAVMQHVEEAGVHSGDSACVLPAPSLDVDDGARGRERRPAARARARHRRPDQRPARRRRRRRLRARGEPARVADGARSRRRRPGCNLVEAACRLAAGREARATSACRPSGRRSRSASRRRCCRSRASPAATRCSGRRCARPAR